MLMRMNDMMNMKLKKNIGLKIWFVLCKLKNVVWLSMMFKREVSEVEILWQFYSEELKIRVVIKVNVIKMIFQMILNMSSGQ